MPFSWVLSETDGLYSIWMCTSTFLPQCYIRRESEMAQFLSSSCISKRKQPAFLDFAVGLFYAFSQQLARHIGVSRETQVVLQTLGEPANKKTAPGVLKYFSSWGTPVGGVSSQRSMLLHTYQPYNGLDRKTWSDDTEQTHSTAKNLTERKRGKDLSLDTPEERKEDKASESSPFFPKTARKRAQRRSERTARESYSKEPRLFPYIPYEKKIKRKVLPPEKNRQE